MAEVETEPKNILKEVGKIRRPAGGCDLKKKKKKKNSIVLPLYLAMYFGALFINLFYTLKIFLGMDVSYSV